MSKTHPNDHIPGFRLLAFALPAFVSSLMKGPVGAILPTIYAKYHGMDLATIGTILLFTRMFDAVTDPAIGYLSDRTESPFGKRKPWIIAGYSITLIVIYYLFIPPENITIWFFSFWFCMLYLAWTIAEIPYLAWQSELSHDYKQRTRIVTYRAVMITVGTIAFAAFPLLPIFETSEITPQVLRVLAYAILITLPVAVCLSIMLVPQGKQIATHKSQSFFVMLKSIPKNKPMLIYIIITLLFGLAGGMQSAVLFLWIDTYLLIGDKFPIIMLSAALVSLCFMPVWLKIINWVGKNRAWLAVQIGFVSILPFIVLITPGPQAFIPVLVVFILAAIVITGTDIIPPSILGDVIDYDTLKSGQNRAGQYSSILTLILKGNAAIGTGLAFFIVGKMGYDATATSQTTGGITGLMATMVWIPLVLTLIAAYFVWRFPLNEHRQSIIKRRIESLAARKVKLDKSETRMN